MSWLVIAAIIALMLLLSLLLSSKLRARGKELAKQSLEEINDLVEKNRAAMQQAAEERAARAEAERRAAEEKRAALISGLIDSDALVGQQLMREAGIKDGSNGAIEANQEMLARIARQVPDDVVASFSVAARQKVVVVDLHGTTVRSPSQYPTRDVEPSLTDDPARLAQATPELYGLDEDGFYATIASGNIPVVESFETVVTRREAYILLDISRSMDDRMANGMSRDIWARGITVSLLNEAVRNNARFVLIPFANTPLSPYVVNTTNEAMNLVQLLMRNRLNAGNGTDIRAALNAALKHATLSRRNGTTITEIVLITDADRNNGSFGDPEEVRAMLGNDSLLHVVLVGDELPEFMRVATSYKVFL